MKRITRFLALLICICLALSTLSSCKFFDQISESYDTDDADSYAEIQSTVKIMVADGENFEVMSTNPLTVYKGSDAVFAISVDEGYEYKSNTAGAEYVGGVLILREAKFPATIKIELQRIISVDVPGTEVHTHNFAPATCDESSTCTECGEKAGDPLGHDWASDISSDSDNHWYDCKRDGCNARNQLAEHTGGTADCINRAVCTECKRKYGEALDHLWSEELSYNVNMHWYICEREGCNEKKQLQAHYGGNATETEQARCEACNTPYTNPYGPHDHIGGVASCTELAICNRCGLAYGEPLGHDWSEDISYNDTHHWYVCERDGCDEVGFYSVHSGGTATYYEPAVCDVCHLPYGEPLEMPEFETVTLRAEPKDGYHFICWTLDSPAEEGGEVFAEEAEGVFTIPFGRTPVANYVDDGHYVILYRTNGGVTSDGKDYYYQTFSNEHYLMPNTLHQGDFFKKDGYVLLRYTEEADGSGDFTTLGGKIPTNKNGFAELYLMWGKVTDSGLKYSVYAKEDGSYAARVDAYTGTATDVRIPDSLSITLDGESMQIPVDLIVSGAFESSAIESLYLPASLVTVEDGAFKDCKNLKELTIHDNILNITNNAFSRCTSMSQYYLNAGRLPCHAGSGEGMFSMKYERLRAAYEKGEKKILVMSGSSSLYGFLAENMQAAFNNEYTVINYGTNAGANAHFYLDAFMRFFDEGDIIIHAPEMTSGTQFGDVNIEWRVFRGCESMYEVFSYVDMTQYTNFFGALSEFNRTVRNTMSGKSYESWSKFLNEYTDLTTSTDNFNYTTPSGNRANPFNLNAITAARTDRLNALNERIKEKGAIMCLSYAPIADDALADASKPEATQIAFMEKLESMLDYDIISDLRDYILEHKYFNGSIYHPGPTGAAIRTERLIADLKAYLISKGLWSEQ